MQVKNLAKTMIVGFATLASASALAFDFDGVYVLGGVGFAGVNDAEFSDDINNSLVGSGSSIVGAGAGFDDLEADGNFAWRGGVGAWLTDNFAVEFNYFGIADMDDTLDNDVMTSSAKNDAAMRIGGMENKLKVRDMYFFDISGLGRYDFAENFWGFARLGVAWAHVTREITNDFTCDPEVCNQAKNQSLQLQNTRTSSTEDEGGWGAALGIGAQYDITEMFGVRVEASTIQALNNNDMYAVTGNLVLNFGELM